MWSCSLYVLMNMYLARPGLYRSDGLTGVKSGLTDGDIVVTSGQLKLYPSLRVAIVDDVVDKQSTSQ